MRLGRIGQVHADDGLDVRIEGGRGIGGEVHRGDLVARIPRGLDDDASEGAMSARYDQNPTSHGFIPPARPDPVVFMPSRALASKSAVDEFAADQGGGHVGGVRPRQDGLERGVQQAQVGRRPDLHAPWRAAGVFEGAEEQV